MRSLIAQLAERLRSSIRRCILVDASLLLLMFSHAAQAQPEAETRFVNAAQAAQHVVELLQRRLALMPEVAAYKWHAGQSVFDAQREARVISRSVENAGALGLDETAARRLFTIQIELARAVQSAYLSRWQTREQTAPIARDLSSELRPLLDDIGQELLVAVYIASSAQSRDYDLTKLQSLPGVDVDAIASLRQALLEVRVVRAASVESIRRSGVLRIGTTGDYAPFSNERGGRLYGFDIELAYALAKQLKVRPFFIRTSWPSLMDDMATHRFDIAMSGISVTPERAVQADFSVAYHVDGKTAIARCEDAPHFRSLGQIDQPNVRVIVNPGGTNERFVRDHLRRAQIVVHADNRAIFDEILAHHADVMITDGIEVLLQSKRHPELCNTLAASLTQTSKAILLPKGSDIDATVDEFLQPQLASGKLRADLQRALQ